MAHSAWPTGSVWSGFAALVHTYLSKVIVEVRAERSQMSHLISGARGKSQVTPRPHRAKGPPDHFKSHPGNWRLFISLLYSPCLPVELERENGAEVRAEPFQKGYRNKLFSPLCFPERGGPALPLYLRALSFFYLLPPPSPPPHHLVLQSFLAI